VVVSGERRREERGPGPERVTVPVLQVIDVFLAEPERDDWFALEICRRTGLGSGSVAQILFRLQSWGWLVSRWEEAGAAHRNGRPRRRFYRLTGLGAGEARRLLRQRFPGIQRWAPSGGPA
jgi:PadR family transcriptional regulator PadR